MEESTTFISYGIPKKIIILVLKVVLQLFNCDSADLIIYHTKQITESTQVILFYISLSNLGLEGQGLPNH